MKRSCLYCLALLDVKEKKRERKYNECFVS